MPAPHALPTLTWRDLRPPKPTPVAQPGPESDPGPEPTPEPSIEARRADNPKEK